MEDFRSLVRRYQAFDPDTGEFSTIRSDNQYAKLLRVNRALLSRFYAGIIQDSHVLLTAFLRTFPSAAPEVAAAISAREAEHVAIA